MRVLEYNTGEENKVFDRYLIVGTKRNKKKG